MIFKCIYIKYALIKSYIFTSYNNFYYAYFGQFVTRRNYQFDHTFDALAFDLLYGKYFSSDFR